MCEGALGRAASGNGKKRVNPASSTACGFCLSLFFLLPIIGVFLSFLAMTHIPAWLPITPFYAYPSLCCLSHLFGNHLLRVSTVLFFPFTWPLLSVPSSIATPSLLPLCPAFSLMSTSFLPDTAPISPCSMLFPASHLLSGLSGGGSRGAGCEKAPPGRAPAPGLAPLRPSEPTMAVPPGHGPFSGFPRPQEHTQVCVQLAPHLPGGGSSWR